MAKITLDAILDRPARVTDCTTPIFAVRLLKVTPGRFDRLYGEIASFMRGRSRRHWSKAQWDMRLGGLLEEILANAKTLHFSLYSGDRFPGVSAQPVPVMSKKLEA